MSKPKKTAKHKPIPLRLKEHRDRLGWSQARLAEAMESSDATINRIEAGDQNWNQEFLQEAARALGVTVADLLPVELVASDPDLVAFLSLEPAKRSAAVKLASAL